ncbi:hypothetical protein J5751_01820 [bacterium]|nr:hypothetical protein [bacterium]
MWLRDFTFKRLAPELEKSIVKILTAMKATPDQILATRKQIQDLLE